jgi:hypothetical protein
MSSVAGGKKKNKKVPAEDIPTAAHRWQSSFTGLLCSLRAASSAEEQIVLARKVLLSVCLSVCRGSVTSCS